MDRLNFNHFYYFYIIAHEGSIKSAAEKLHVSQPTISDQLKLLEEYFDCKLFERRNRGLYLTREGKLALAYAEKIFSISREATYKLRNKNGLPKKCLDIGIPPNLSQYFPYDTILPFFNQSDLAVKVREEKRHYLLADLEEGKIDLLFTDTIEGISQNLKAYSLGLNRTFAVGHEKFKTIANTFPELLNAAPFFHYTGDSYLKYEIDLFFTKNGVTPKIIGEGDDIELIQLITEKGIAITIVPEVAMNRFINNKDICVLGELKELQTSLWGVVRSDYKGFGHKLLTNQLQ